MNPNVDLCALKLIREAYMWDALLIKLGMWNKLGLLGYPELWDKPWLGCDSTVGWNHELLCGSWTVLLTFLSLGWNHELVCGM